MAADGDPFLLWPIHFETVFLWDAQIEGLRIVATMWSKPQPVRTVTGGVNRAGRPL